MSRGLNGAVIPPAFPSKRLPPWPKPRPPKTAASRQARGAAGMEPGRPLSGHRCARSSSAISSAPTRDCAAFEQAYKGKLAALAAARRAGRALAEAVRRYEAIDDLLGRLDLLCRRCSMPATPPIRRAPSSTATCRSASPRPRSHLLFFTLELNRIDDAHARCRDGAIPRSAITGPGSRTCARKSPISSRTGSSNCSTRNR